MQSMMSSMMGNPMMQSMMNNPEALRGMLQSNPTVRQVSGQLCKPLRPCQAGLPARDFVRQRPMFFPP